MLLSSAGTAARFACRTKTSRPPARYVMRLRMCDNADIYETYDARIEKEALLSRHAHARVTNDMLKGAVNEALAICKSNDTIQECAVFWDVVDELFHALARQYDHDQELANGEPWSLKQREYDL